MFGGRFSDVRYNSRREQPRMRTALRQSGALICRVHLPLARRTSALSFGNHGSASPMPSLPPSFLLPGGGGEEQWPSRGESKGNNGGKRKEGRKVRMTGGTKVKRTRKGHCRCEGRERASERRGEVRSTGAELRTDRRRVRTFRVRHCFSGLTRVHIRSATDKGGL